MMIKNSPHNHFIPLILLILVSTAIYSNTFNNSFMWDDEELIVEDRTIRHLKNIPKLFTPDYWANHHPGATGQYRPLRTLTFAIDYSLWGLNPRGFHITNLALHVLNVILVYFFSFYIIKPEKRNSSLLGIPFLAALFFATHPIHTESVTWIKNRSDILSFIFYLSSIIVFTKYCLKRNEGPHIFQYLLSLVCFVGALCSKEMALSLPLILISYIICFQPEEERKLDIVKTLPFFAVALISLLFKVIYFGTINSSVNVEQISSYDNILVVFKTIGVYLTLLIFPFRLNAERSLPVPESFYEPGVLLAVIGFILLCVVLVRKFKQSRLCSFSITWILLTLIPVSNVVFLSGRPLAEQRLYIPSLGLCLILALALQKLRSKAISIILVCAILLGYSTAVVKRNFDWRDSITFWKKTVASSPNSDRAYNNLGKAYYHNGNKEEAIKKYKEAIAINSRYGLAYYNLGGGYADLGQFEEAIPYLKKAVELSPDYSEAHFRLGSVYHNMNEGREAIPYYNKAIKTNLQNALAYNNLGNVYLELGEPEKALVLFEQGVTIDEDNAVLTNNLGNVYLKLGHKDKSILFFKKAIAIDPTNASAYYNLGGAYYESKQFEEAIVQYNKSMTIGREYANVNNDIGNAYMELGKYKDAIISYQKALAINPEYGSAHNNLAVAYYYVQDYDLALKHSDKAIDLGHDTSPDFLKSLEPYRK